MKRVRRTVLAAGLLALALGIPAASGAECFTIIASTPTGATFPCTVCVEGGRPISALCTPAVVGK